MEKYGVLNNELILGLRNEEAQLMTKAGELATRLVKTASEESELQRLEARLHSVRQKLTELDLKGE